MTTEEMSDQEVRKFVREHPWRPGTFGKGIVTPTGTPISWDDEWGVLHHRHVMTAMGVTQYGRYNVDSGAFFINRDGSIELEGTTAEKHRDRIKQHVDKLMEVK